MEDSWCCPWRFRIVRLDSCRQHLLGKNLSDGFCVTVPNVPLWMGLSNRLFSLTAIWFPVIYAFQRRKIEEALRSAHDELEVRGRTDA